MPFCCTKRCGDRGGKMRGNPAGTERPTANDIPCEKNGPPPATHPGSRAVMESARVGRTIRPESGEKLPAQRQKGSGECIPCTRGETGSCHAETHSSLPPFVVRMYPDYSNGRAQRIGTPVRMCTILFSNARTAKNSEGSCFGDESGRNRP